MIIDKHKDDHSFIENENCKFWKKLIAYLMCTFEKERTFFMTPIILEYKI